VAGGWRRLHNEELHKLYFVSDIALWNWRGWDCEIGGLCSTYV